MLVNSANGVEVPVFTLNAEHQGLTNLLGDMKKDPKLLNHNANGFFNLLIEHQKRQFDAGRQPFFFQDNKRTYLVSPVDSPSSELLDGSNASADSGASIGKKYYVAPFLGGSL